MLTKDEISEKVNLHSMYCEKCKANTIHSSTDVSDQRSDEENIYDEDYINSCVVCRIKQVAECYVTETYLEIAINNENVLKKHLEDAHNFANLEKLMP